MKLRVGCTALYLIQHISLLVTLTLLGITETLSAYYSDASKSRYYIIL